MHLDLSTLFEFLFPKSDDEKLLQTITPTSFAQKLQPVTHTTITSLTSFKDPAIRAAIHLTKFHNHAHATKLLSGVLTKYLQENYSDRDVLLVPIPLSKKRQRQRGYNQVVQVIKKCELPKRSVYRPVLIRTKDTTPQTSLSKAQRLTNLNDVFSIAKGNEHVLANTHVLIIDDVTTTGTTLRSAKEAFAGCGVTSVTCIALAH